MTIDLRSDTVTRPSPGMREAMARAPVGDDIYGEDPTARALEALAAELLGKEAALFVPSGTMGNQIALMLHCRPGDDVIIGQHAHCKLYESGAGAALGGVQFSVAGQGGRFSASELEAAMNPPAAFYTPRTRLVTIENTHNRAGGVVWPLDQVLAVTGMARALGLALHLDGARIWNAAAALGLDAATLCAPFDTVSACLSKGLGAPVGSILAGPKEMIETARRLRKMLGGAMRQVGILCAGGIYALEHNLTRIPVDHQRARRFAEAIAGLDGVRIDLASVQTNIVLFGVDDAAGFVDRMSERGVLLSAFGPGMIRVVTHLDVGEAHIDEASARVAEVLGG